MSFQCSDSPPFLLVLDDNPSGVFSGCHGNDTDHLGHADFRLPSANPVHPPASCCQAEMHHTQLVPLEAAGRMLCPAEVCVEQKELGQLRTS